MRTETLVKVLVVEDSITTRRFLVKLINEMPGLMVCGEAYDGVEAVRLTAEVEPDVISMDIQMPRMDGVEATRQIMAKFPTPIVVASNGIGQREVDVAMQALAAGAVAAIPKPDAAPYGQANRMDYLRMLRYMARVSVVRRYANQQTAQHMPDVPATKATPQLVVIGASAGGPGALARIIGRLPQDFPVPVLIVQHLAKEFVEGFAHWLNRTCNIYVQVAAAGEVPLAGEVWIAPGGHHMTLRSNGQIMLHSEQGDYRHQPAIDVLFESAVALCGQHLVGVLLSGMGEDGAHGLQLMYDVGAHTIVQDEATSVVFGMPAAAIDRGAAQMVLPDGQIAQTLLELCTS